MDLLTAINISLTATGEAIITSEISPNPSVGVIKYILNNTKRSLLASGWWFNTAIVTLKPDRDGLITAPTNTLEVYTDNDLNYAVRKRNQLYNVTENTYTFTGPVKVVVTLDIDFEDLPEMAAQTIAYSTASEFYSNDLGVDNTYQTLSSKANAAFQDLFKQDLRHKKYRTMRMSQYRRLQSYLYI